MGQTERTEALLKRQSCRARERQRAQMALVAGVGSAGAILLPRGPEAREA